MTDMKIGVFHFPTDEGLHVARLAKELEDRGFDALMLPDHTHIPVGRKTPYPDVYGGGDLPEFYKRTYDVFTALAFAAASTTTLKVGTGICLVGQRDFIVTAKQIASLDHLSDGRFIFGIGFGWNADEGEAHGLIWDKRFTIVKEKVAAMKELWTQEEASYEGEHIQLAKSWAWPKPVQKPYPPIYLGGGGPLTMRHAARWADAWYPAPHPDEPGLQTRIAKYRALAEEMGRAPETVRIAVSGAPPERELLEQYREQGVERVTLWLDPGSPDEVLRGLDAMTDVVKEMA